MRLAERIERIKNFLREKASPKAFLIGGLTILVIIFLILMVLRITQKLAPPTGAPPIPSPPPAPTPTLATEQSYFINRTSSLFPVTGYSWHQQELVYSTPKGIYRAGLNVALVTAAVEEVSWSHNGQALYRSGGSWFWFNASLGQAKPITLTGINPQISPDGQWFVSANNGQLEVAALDSGAKVTKEIDAEIQTIRWSATSNQLAVATKSPTKTTIQIFDASLNAKETLTLEADTSLLDISPDASTLLLSQPRKVILRSLTTGTTQIEFQSVTKITGNFIAPRRAIVVETTIDSLGREFNYFWRINESGEKEYLANSLPIPRKIDTSAPLIPNPLQSVLPVIEKRGPLWLVGLLPSLLPTYSERGLTFFPLSTEGHPDVGP